jgi:hypothetical protein
MIFFNFTLKSNSVIFHYILFLFNIWSLFFYIFFWIDSFSILSFNFGLVGNWGLCIVFRPGLRLGFRVLTVLPGRPGQFFFLNQNDVVLVKKKQKSTGCNRVLPGYTGFFLPLFFLQPGPVLVPGRPAGPGFKTMIMNLKG